MDSNIFHSPITHEPNVLSLHSHIVLANAHFTLFYDLRWSVPHVWGTSGQRMGIIGTRVKTLRILMISKSRYPGITP